MADSPTPTQAMTDAIRRLQQHGGSLPVGAFPATVATQLIEAGLAAERDGRLVLT
jgi:hypothetical protein